MSRIKIIENAGQEKTLQPGRSKINNQNRPEFIEILRRRRNYFENLFNKLNTCPNLNGNRIFYIKYSEVVPKSSRVIFSKTYNSIDHVPQIGANIDENNNFKIYYRFSQNDFVNQLAKIEQLTNVNDTISNNQIEFGISLLGIMDISWDVFANTNLTTSVRFLPIFEVINEIIDEGLVDNYDSISKTGLVTGENLSIIQTRYPGLIYDSFELHPLIMDINEIDELDLNIQITGEANGVTIGVIDSGLELPEQFTGFIESSEDCRENEFSRDLKHGSAVCSLIIANDELNPSAPDNLGNFAVRHFEVIAGTTSYMHIANEIIRIVESNLDIKIWNLSFGGLKSPYKRSISSLGMILDYLSSKYKLLFIVAAGNDRQYATSENLSLNSPADSINAISVGSVIKTKKGVDRSSYSSFGPILHYEKPEVSNFGGSTNYDGSALKMYYNGLIELRGTSFAAPRVARMAAHLLSEGYSISQIKATLVTHTHRETKGNKSSSFGWLDKFDQSTSFTDERIFSNNKPYYIPLELINNITSINISSSHIVEPLPNLGEEYSIDNFEIALAWCDTNFDQFERDKRKMIIKEHGSHKEFLTESKLRFESGKYFNTQMKSYSIDSITSTKAIAQAKWPDANLSLFIRVRKLSLFDIPNREITAGFVCTFFGNFNEEELIEINEEILDIEIDLDV